jgi:regulator of protease activity HflC (stomatin/prohibitin superfamily)
MILEAEGRRESAQRDAEARERLAQAEGKAVTSVSDAIQAGTAQATNYFIAQKYVEAVRSFADSKQQKLMILPLEATSLMGTVAAMVDMVQDMGKTPTTPGKKSS